MLEEILKTRFMVKQSMKAYKQDRALSRMLDARQLGLKLIANVTFGYTSANFSGRMPCIEVGDSIVHKARETLERAIKLVNDTKKWGARVVYGDTDSMFVLLKGATKEQSFKIGQEIAEAVTATNPKPVKLKFEKVYLPCVLQTKKRYVGYMYETLDQKDPVFDAKGIETVRRDSCPAVSKILERSLKLLFETRDISLIKQYVQRQCMKLLEGKASIQDFIFAKEYRGSFSYKPGACVPALELTRKMLTYDRRSEPQVGERVPYVIIYGTPGVPLIQLVRRPVEVLQDPTLRLNATYYITKQILPPLARIFSLIGIDVFSWYHELPRIHKATSSSRSEPEGRKGTISQYFTTLHCPVCDDLTQHGICSKSCCSHPQPRNPGVGT
uniref:DNA polymerase zeta catalytic subunit n=3 Tax=Hominoidea TaxID=314295 RepID=A0A2I3TFE3_PANTR